MSDLPKNHKVITLQASQETEKAHFCSAMWLPTAEHFIDSAGYKLPPASETFPLRMSRMHSFLSNIRMHSDTADKDHEKGNYA